MEEEQPVKRLRRGLRMRQFINPASFVLMLLVGSCHLWERWKKFIEDTCRVCTPALRGSHRRPEDARPPGVCGLTCIHIVRILTTLGLSPFYRIINWDSRKSAGVGFPHCQMPCHSHPCLCQAPLWRSSPSPRPPGFQRATPSVPLTLD